VQGATEFHHQITDARLPQADPVLHDAAALDTAVDMLDPQPPLVEPLVRPLVLPRQLRYVVWSKIWKRTIFVKFMAHPVPPSQLEFHLILADTDRECKMS
jgi:hypothetical protein